MGRLYGAYRSARHSLYSLQGIQTMLTPIAAITYLATLATLYATITIVSTARDWVVLSHATHWSRRAAPCDFFFEIGRPTFVSSLRIDALAVWDVTWDVCAISVDAIRASLWSAVECLPDIRSTWVADTPGGIRYGVVVESVGSRCVGGSLASAIRGTWSYVDETARCRAEGAAAVATIVLLSVIGSHLSPTLLAAMSFGATLPVGLRDVLDSPAPDSDSPDCDICVRGRSLDVGEGIVRIGEDWYCETCARVYLRSDLPDVPDVPDDLLGE